MTQLEALQIYEEKTSRHGFDASNIDDVKALLGTIEHEALEEFVNEDSEHQAIIMSPFFDWTVESLLELIGVGAFKEIEGIDLLSHTTYVSLERTSSGHIRKAHAQIADSKQELCDVIAKQIVEGKLKHMFEYSEYYEYVDVLINAEE